MAHTKIINSSFIAGLSVSRSREFV
jgi:hypothetical protein